MRIQTIRQYLLVVVSAAMIAACTLPGMPSAEPTLTGDAIRVEAPSARPASAGSNSAAYLTIVNPLDQPDRLLSANSSVARVTELHETVEDDGIMRMMPRPEGFEVPAGSETVLKAGGKHVMFLEITGDLDVGSEFELTLTFENAGPLTVMVPVVEQAGMGMAIETEDSGDMSQMDMDDMSTTGGMPADALERQMGENGLFQVQAISQMDPVTINEIHAWTLHVENAQGEPVENAEIQVAGSMPAHDHGLPTAPQVTEYLGNGDYLLEGMKFNMGGAWVLDLTITADGQTDTVRFEFELQ